MSTESTFDFIYKGGASKRYHTCRTLKEQDIAAHSFGVAMLCELITEGRARKELLMAALCHDLAEHIVGDIPSPAKRSLGISEQFGKYEESILNANGLGGYEASLSQDEKVILKYADIIDGMMFCLTELRYGNLHLGVVFKNFHSYAVQLKETTGVDFPVAQEIVDKISKEYREEITHVYS